MLKLFVTNLDEVDEKYHDLYEKIDGGFSLTVDDADQKKKLAEFRTNNRTLHNSVEAMKKKLDALKGIDPAKYAEAVEALDKLGGMEEAELLRAGKLDEVVEKRTTAMRSDFETRAKAQKAALETASTERDTLRGRLSSLLIDSSMRDQLAKVGRLRPAATGDALSRARTAWKVDGEGKLISTDAGGNQLYDKKGDPMTMETWAQQLLQDAPHLFEKSKGGNADGGNPGGGPPAGSRVIDGSDPIVVGQNLADIAAGKVTVTSSGTDELD